MKVMKFEGCTSCQKTTKLKLFQDNRPKFDDSVGAQKAVSGKEEDISVLGDRLFRLVPVHKKINVFLHF